MDALKTGTVRTTVVLRDQDGLDVTIHLVVLTHMKTTDIMKAVRSACEEYCKTEEGREVYKHNCNNFNWGDFLLNVPTDICNKHGFHKESLCNCCEVDFNEQLVDEENIL